MKGLKVSGYGVAGAFAVGCLMVFGAALAWQVATDPVRYSAGCFQPDRLMRVECHRQRNIMIFRMRVARAMSDPKTLLAERERLVRHYEFLLSKGIAPEELGLGSPKDLEKSIEILLVEQFGREI